MTDNESTNLSRNVCDDGEHENRSVNQKISDPEILEAITISLREAKEAFEETVEITPMDLRSVAAKDTFEETVGFTQMDFGSVAAKDAFDETVEITPMDLRSVAVKNAFEETVEITPMDFGSVAIKPKDDEACVDVSGKANNETKRSEKQEVEKPSKRIKTTPVPLRKIPDWSRKVLDKNDNVNDYTDDIDESFSEDEVDNKLPKGDTDYKPGKMKSDQRKQKRVSFRNKIAKNGVSKSVSVVATPGSSHTIAMFECGNCTFRSNTLGELKMHKHENHESCEAPSYLDMAEAALTRIDGGSGVEEILILKEVLFEHFDAITEEKAEAARLLKQALRAGVRLGRLQVLRRKRGKETFNVFKIVSKDKMMLVLERWKNNKEAVEFKGDSTRSRKQTPKVEKKIGSIGGGRTTVKFVSKEIARTDDSEPVRKNSLVSKNKQMLMKLKQSPNHEYAEWCKPQNLIPHSPDSYQEPDSLTCSVCWLSFWYESQASEHRKLEHGEGNERSVIVPLEARDPIADQVGKDCMEQMDVGEKIICEVDLPMQLVNNETTESSVVKGGEMEGVKRKSYG